MSEYVENGKKILRTLQQNGYDAYFVGGFVRDYLLHHDSNDIDITTSATPKEVSDIFQNVKETGKNFGGVTVVQDGYKYEVTTFRLEGKYKRHRYPSDVTFSTNVKDDIIRRDFTINALLMNDHEEILDYVDGKQDLQNRIIRAIGEPTVRFEEDALRILRAFRFVSKLGFTIEEKTQRAISSLSHLVQTVKIERVMQELDKIMSNPHAKQALEAMIESGVHKELYGLEKGIEWIVRSPYDVTTIELYIIAFILDDVSEIWRFSNKDLRLIYQVINLHEVTKNDSFNKFIVFSNKLEPCLLANHINVILGYPSQEEVILNMWNNMPVKDVCDLAFKGQDILELTTMKKRSDIGLVIDDLLFNVIMGIMPNEYEVLKDFALKRIEELQNEVGEDYE